MPLQEPDTHWTRGWAASSGGTVESEVPGPTCKPATWQGPSGEGPHGREGPVVEQPLRLHAVRRRTRGGGVGGVVGRGGGRRQGVVGGRVGRVAALHTVKHERTRQASQCISMD